MMKTNYRCLQVAWSFTVAGELLKKRHYQRLCLLTTSVTSSTRSVYDLDSDNLQRTKLVPLKGISREELGTSILYSSTSDKNAPKAAHEVLRRRVCITKILSLSSSALGLAMVPVLTNYLWASAVDCAPIMAVAVLANSFLGLLSLTPFLLQFLVKRFIADIYYNPNTKIFTTIHYGFWLNKKALRFFADDVVDAAIAPEMKKLWLPLATVFVHGRPLLLSLNSNAYKNKEAFLELTRNVKIAPGSD